MGSTREQTMGSTSESIKGQGVGPNGELQADGL